jgi:hypothetical protein
MVDRIKSMTNSSDPIGNRTQVLPCCSAVPVPTAPPRAPYSWVGTATSFSLSYGSVHPKQPYVIICSTTVEFGYTSWKELNIWCSYKRVLL